MPGSVVDNGLFKYVYQHVSVSCTYGTNDMMFGASIFNWMANTCAQFSQSWLVLQFEDANLQMYNTIIMTNVHFMNNVQSNYSLH